MKTVITQATELTLALMILRQPWMASLYPTQPKLRWKFARKWVRNLLMARM